MERKYSCGLLMSWVLIYQHVCACLCVFMCDGLGKWFHSPMDQGEVSRMETECEPV